MKRLISFLIVVAVGLGIAAYREELFEFVVLNFVFKDSFVYDKINEYKIDYNYQYAQNTENFKPNSKQDIINIIYTGINNGWDSFSYFCSKDYETCIEDSKEVVDNSSRISYINNFVHPYNSFINLKILINELGKVTVNVTKLYNESEINAINSRVDEIYNQIINNSMTTKDKIMAIHDYIINTTVYDEEKAKEVGNRDYLGKYKSQSAYGPLIQGYGICGGYSDAMAIFLYKMGIQNYKVSSTNHVWNLVNLDGVWYHLDLTWDDPVVNTKENLLLHNFFLISTSDLENKKTGQHVYDKNIFIEAQ